MSFLTEALIISGIAMDLVGAGVLSHAHNAESIAEIRADAWSSDNSQHLLDPYSFTHVLHGFAFYGLLALIVPRLPAVWRLPLAVSIEALWEVVENSEFVIRRYREGTAALGYYGDTVVNSLADIVLCGLGFALARRLGFRRTVALFVATELVLAIWIRDNLSLNILMLIYPIDAIREWQAAGH